MSDIGLFWDLGSADFAIEANDLATDDGLETAVSLSLFTDRRAEDGDALPSGDADRRGWWGDDFPAVDGDRMGSRLWLLARSKQTPDVLERAREYAREALAWLVEDGVAASVDATAEVVRTGFLGLTVTVYRPSGQSTRFRYDYNWEAQAARRTA